MTEPTTELRANQALQVQPLQQFEAPTRALSAFLLAGELADPFLQIRRLRDLAARAAGNAVEAAAIEAFQRVYQTRLSLSAYLRQDRQRVRQSHVDELVEAEVPRSGARRLTALARHAAEEQALASCLFVRGLTQSPEARVERLAQHLECLVRRAFGLWRHEVERVVGACAAAATNPVLPVLHCRGPKGPAIDVELWVVPRGCVPTPPCERMRLDGAFAPAHLRYDPRVFRARDGQK